MKHVFFYILFSFFAINITEAKVLYSDKSLIILIDEFKRVKSSELTPPVIEQILKEYPTSKLAAVYKNDKGEFKLIMVLQSGSRRTVFIDQYGRWFKPKR